MHRSNSYDSFRIKKYPEEPDPKSVFATSNEIVLNNKSANIPDLQKINTIYSDYSIDKSILSEKKKLHKHKNHIFVEKETTEINDYEIESDYETLKIDVSYLNKKPII